MEEKINFKYEGTLSGCCGDPLPEYKLCEWDRDGTMHVYFCKEEDIKSLAQFCQGPSFRIYLGMKFNWLQKKMWKWFFNMEIVDYVRKD